MTREIVLDTETTGIDPSEHRLVDIACIELDRLLPTGRRFQTYLNPQRACDPEAVQVHGLTDQFLADKPIFPEIVEEFLSFIGQDRLIIHNAAFDLGFLNAELRRCGYPPIPDSRALDTVALARQKRPGAAASLDALCRHYGIDLSGRVKHGAMVDTELLARVYLELSGGVAPKLGLIEDPARGSAAVTAGTSAGGVAAGMLRRPVRPARPHAATPAEHALHQAMLALLKAPLWPLDPVAAPAEAAE